MPNITEYTGSLDEFLDLLDTRTQESTMEMMNFQTSLKRALSPLNHSYWDPIIRLYNGYTLVASTAESDVKSGAKCVRDLAYWVLKGLKDYGSPISVLGLSDENFWEIPPGKHTNLLCTSLKGLSDVGVITKTGEKDGSGYDILKIGNTMGFRVEYLLKA